MDTKPMIYIPPSLRLKLARFFMGLAGRLIRVDNEKASFFIHFINKPARPSNIFFLPSGDAEEAIYKWCLDNLKVIYDKR